MTEQAVVAAEAAAHGKPKDYKVAGLSLGFGTLVRRLAERQAEAEVAAEKVEALRGVIKQVLEKSGVGSVTVDGHWQPTLCAGRKASQKIDGMKLMQINPTVTADQIVKATVTGEPGQPYLLVTDLTKPRKHGEDGRTGR